MDMVYLNGELVSSDEAVVSVFDRGFMYGDGAFETVRVYDGCPFRGAEHWRRLAGSLDKLAIPVPLTPNELDKVCTDVLEANGIADAVVRVRISRGVGPRGPGTAFETRPTVVVTAAEYKVQNTSFYTRGVDVVISSVRRIPDSCLPCDAKSANYLNSILARRDAEAAGVYESIMLNTEGNVTEASGSNVFFVADNVCRTPDLHSGILPGITRRVVIECAAEMGYPVQETSCSPAELRTADEVFLTNSVIELIPVRSVDAALVGRQCPGPVTQRLTAAYKDRVAMECGK